MAFADFRILLLAVLATVAALVLAAACRASARLGHGWARGLLMAVPLVHLWAIFRLARAAPRRAQGGMGRRAFVLGASALTAAGAALAGTAAPADPRRLLPPGIDAAAVARSYLRTAGAGERARRLAAWLRGRTAPLAALEERVAAEFARHDVVVAEGWVLSQTEAQLCVLTWLEGGR